MNLGLRIVPYETGLQAKNYCNVLISLENSKKSHPQRRNIDPFPPRTQILSFSSRILFATKHLTYEEQKTALNFWLPASSLVWQRWWWSVQCSYGSQFVKIGKSLWVGGLRILCAGLSRSLHGWTGNRGRKVESTCTDSRSQNITCS